MGTEFDQQKQMYIVGELSLEDKVAKKFILQKFFYDKSRIMVGFEKVILGNKRGLMYQLRKLNDTSGRKHFELGGIIFPLTFGNTNKFDGRFLKYQDKLDVPVFEAYKYYPGYESAEILLNSNIQGRMHYVESAFDDWLKENFEKK